MLPGIRPLQPEDRPQLRALLSAAEVFTAEEIDVASELIELDDDEYRFVVADEHGAAVGYACFGRALFTAETWELYWIVVSTDRRRRGVGHALLGVVETEAAAERARLLLIETSSQASYEPARRLYASHGYAEIARICSFYSEGDDKVVYAKSLRGDRPIERADHVRIADSPGRGRGVFAARAFAAGETIERAPVIDFSPEEWTLIARTRLSAFCFKWGEDDESGAVGLGYTSLYNHSFSPNARFVVRLAEREIEYVAIRAIAPGEEIFANYNRDPDDRGPVWFEPT